MGFMNLFRGPRKKHVEPNLNKNESIVSHGGGGVKVDSTKIRLNVIQMASLRPEHKFHGLAKGILGEIKAGSGNEKHLVEMFRNIYELNSLKEEGTPGARRAELKNFVHTNFQEYRSLGADETLLRDLLK
ncbi:MAG: hypothetical protein ABH854_04865 [Candidatus Diapherotrites archaeon]|nr:hypothetical protein [Candidatus Micrarchaeota archaeon]